MSTLLAPAARVDPQRSADLDATDAAMRDEDEWMEADLWLELGKAERKARQQYERAMDLQLNGSGVRL